MSDLPPTNQDIYENGDLVLIIAGKSELIEEAVIEASQNGPKMDWHFAGGSAVVKTLGNISEAVASLNLVLEDNKYVDIQQ